MIPTPDEARRLWDTYDLPDVKRNHCSWVARLSLWFAGRITEKRPEVVINTVLLEAAALLHDIDKAVAKLPGERHPDTAVRILRKEGLDEIADLVRTHPLHAILDQNLSPKTWEAKILYLSDKMVKHGIITVDERFALWRVERLPKEAVTELDAAYPRVKALENELCSITGVLPTDVGKLATEGETSTMKVHSVRRKI